MSDPKFILSKKKIGEQFDKVAGICDVVSYSSKTNPIVAGILEKENFLDLLGYVIMMEHCMVYGKPVVLMVRAVYKMRTGQLTLMCL